MRISGLYPDVVHQPLSAPLVNGGSWTVPSDRHPEIRYTVTRLPDGTWECNCPGCRYGARPDGLCKHVDRVQGWLASVQEAVLSWSGELVQGAYRDRIGPGVPDQPGLGSERAR